MRPVALVALVFPLLAGTQARVPAPEAPDPCTRVVATHELIVGHRLEAADVRTVPMACDLVASGQYASADAVMGLVVTQRMLPGDLLRSERLGAPRSLDGLATVVLDVTVGSAVPGFVVSGDQVDVVHTGLDDGEPVTRTLVEAATVAAVDSEAQTVTLLLPDPVAARVVTTVGTDRVVLVQRGARPEGSCTQRSPTAGGCSSILRDL